MRRATQEVYEQVLAGSRGRLPGSRGPEFTDSAET
jgi:hypothetical protein